MFRILFLTPEIPGNTGNAIRLAAITGAELHLVEPLGFDFSDAKLRRAGLDYHDLAVVTVHKTLVKLDPHITARVRLPMLPSLRSLNLANAASIAVYEAWRQNGFAGAQIQA